MDEFLESLMGLFRAITNHLESQDNLIKKLADEQHKTMQDLDNIHQQLDLLFEDKDNVEG